MVAFGCVFILNLIEFGENIQYFGYGYHPYIGLDGKSIDDLVITTNLTHNVPLNSITLLPEIDNESKVKRISIENVLKYGQSIGDLSLDHLFYYDLPLGEYREPYVQLADAKSGICIEIRGKLGEFNWPIPLHWWQIYTPPDRKRIAIEPQSSPGNGFAINYPNYLVECKGSDKLKGEFEISLRKLYEE